MFTLELSSIVMKIANYAYRTPDWLILENNEKATLGINTPY